MQTYSILIFILVTVAIVAIASNRTRIPAAILLVLVGLLISLMPGLPRVELSPELVLLLVVPPLIYSAGVAMSWREFRYNIRSISLLAFGGVTFTTVAVAAVVHFLLGLGLVDRLRARRDHLAARRGRADGDRAPARHAAADHGRHRGRGSRQRCHGADPVPLRRRRGVARHVFVRLGGARVRRHHRRRDRIRAGGRISRACGCADGPRTRASRSSSRCSRRSPPIGRRKRSAAPASSPPWCAASTSAGTGRCSFRATPGCRASSSGTSSSFCWRAGCSS